ncbi:MAG: SDR family oxidoreductase [Acidimicrobiia bacterium]|nr:SDR family oxidoreductase [Acidimicrobiia bacterium]
MSTRPVALVTGASAGIGEAIARRLAADGHDLVVVARSADRLAVLAKDLEAEHGGDVEVLVADLTDGEQLARVEARLGDPDRPIDLLVNNAGYGTVGTFVEMPADREENEIALNVVALMRLTHAALGPMKERKRGAILNVSSLAGQQPTPGMATYGATKAFVTSFTMAVREEVRGSGIRITVLAPGFTNTEFQARAGVDEIGVPGILLQSPDEVAKAGLDALTKDNAIVVSGWLNWAAATATKVVPTSVVRRVTSLVMKRSKVT